jgi:HNH endonuclease
VLHRVENASVTFRYGTFSMTKGHVRLQVGTEIVDFGRVTPKEFRQLQVEQQEYPLRLAKIGERRYWQFQDRVYWENEDLDADEVYALLVSQQQRERGRIERAKAMVAMGMQPQDQAQRRDVIPDDVKQLVWLRDGGRRRHCGAQTELQYDHVIPVAMGGSSAPENLQILCGPCNRRKSAGLTIR